jgi:putative tryptophan/tyrosine transport system substrate-binding protein
MNRRVLLLGLASLLGTVSGMVQAQERERVPIVGVLTASAGPDDPSVQALREGLRELGYVEGRNIRFEYRAAQGQAERLPQLAKQLVALKSDVIVLGNEEALRAAQQATSAIPIVMIFLGDDPVAAGLIDSLSRPGGNVTGVAVGRRELVGKRLELLKDLLPGVSRVAVLWDAYGRGQLDQLAPAARSLGLQLQLIELQAPYDFKAAFQAAKKRAVGAVLLMFSPVFNQQRHEIATLSVEYRLPAISANPNLAKAGTLMSYGSDNVAAFGRAAYFVHRLLKGAKPAELPVEQAVTIKLIVNLRTAKAIGVVVPESILLRTDEVIR